MCGHDRKSHHQLFAPMGSCSSVDPPGDLIHAQYPGLHSNTNTVMDSGRGNIKLKVSRLLLQVKHIQNRRMPPWPSQQEVILQRHAATHGRPLPYGQSDKRPGQVKLCQFCLSCENKANDIPPTHPTRRQRKG